MNKKQLLDLVELAVAWIAGIPLEPIIILLAVIGVGIGLFFSIKPSVAIEIQRRFYENINWKMEPVSMQKEIRNTRLMGWFLICLVVAALSFILVNPWLFQ